MNSRGALFVVDRGFHPSISELAPTRKILADHYQGEPLDCSGVVLNDLMADSKGGAYFTMGGVFYASPTGQITRYDGKNLKGWLLGLVLRTIGRGVLERAFENSVKAIELRNSASQIIPFARSSAR